MIKSIREYLESIAAVAVVCVFGVWLCYGIVYIKFDGAQKVKSTVYDIFTMTEVCEGRDNTGWWRPMKYAGYSLFCFPVNNQMVCFDLKISCASTENEAYRLANITNPIGSHMETWWYQSRGEVWVITIDINLWLQVSIWITVGLGILILALCVILICNKVREIRAGQEGIPLLVREEN